VTVRPLFQFVRQYVGPEERKRVLAEIGTCADELRRVDGRGGIGPRYSVLGGDVIRASLPGVVAIGERVREALAQYAGAPVEPLEDRVRNSRVQIYTEREDGFRWHFDGHDYAAVVTLENDSGGVTELIPAGLSRMVRPLFYPAYALPQIFSLLPRRAVAAEAGDALLFTGSRYLHRGRSRGAGRRTILVFAFDHAGRRRSAFRKWLARRVNY
jgi:hypothetical protein